MKFKTLNISKYHNIIISKINNTVIIENIKLQLKAELFLIFLDKNSKNKLLLIDVSLLSFKGFISIFNNSLFSRNLFKLSNSKGTTRPANQNLVTILVVLINLRSSAEILEGKGRL